MRLLFVACLALSSACPAFAQSAAQAPLRDIDTIVVSGVQPGPGMWKVSKGDHVLWLLGTVQPMPRGLEWQSPQADAVLAQADEIIGAPGVQVSMGWGGLFKAAFAAPTLLKVRRIPDSKTLRDVLPVDLYVRWTSLKSQYLPDDDEVESRRPLFAAGELYQAALKRARLDGGNQVARRVEAVVGKREVRRTRTAVSSQITNPKGVAKSFANGRLDDIACFRSQLDRLESDVVVAAERANAWAVGDIAELQRLQPLGAERACSEAILKTETARMLGIADGDARSESQWLAAAETALARSGTSFGVLPMSHLLAPDGLLARLQARGYAVIAPE